PDELALSVLLAMQRRPRLLLLFVVRRVLLDHVLQDLHVPKRRVLADDVLEVLRRSTRKPHRFELLVAVLREVRPDVPLVAPLMPALRTYPIAAHGRLAALHAQTTARTTPQPALLIMDRIVEVPRLEATRPHPRRQIPGLLVREVPKVV